MPHRYDFFQTLCSYTYLNLRMTSLTLWHHFQRSLVALFFSSTWAPVYTISSCVICRTHFSIRRSVCGREEEDILDVDWPPSGDICWFLGRAPPQGDAYPSEVLREGLGTERWGSWFSLYLLCKMALAGTVSRILLI